MEFKSLMHVSFFTDNMEKIRDFYENKLGLKPKIITYYSAYKGLNRGYFSEMAKTNPDDIAIIYIELAPGQFVEFFPKSAGQGPHVEEWNKNLGYSHFALLVDDIYKIREEIIVAGIEIDSDISKGPSGTYQMWIHDPDGNKFEIMQYTDKSLQVVGNVKE